MALLLSIVFVGQVPIEVARDVLDDLRAVAIKAGCPPARVRASVRWMGQGQPAILEVSCPVPDVPAGEEPS